MFTYPIFLMPYFHYWKGFFRDLNILRKYWKKSAIAPKSFNKVLRALFAKVVGSSNHHHYPTIVELHTLFGGRPQTDGEFEQIMDYLDDRLPCIKRELIEHDENTVIQ